MRSFHPEVAFAHIHSMRVASGEEVIVARVETTGGSVGFGFSFRLDATEARHMAMWHAGIKIPIERYEAVLGHPWEKAWSSRSPVDWQLEAAFSRLQWLATASESSPSPPPGSSA